MREVAVTLTNELGLHARAAAELVRLASTFRADVKVCREDTGVSADARSLLDVMYLAAGKGVVLKITADGADERDAIARIAELFSHRFGENLV